MKQKFAIGFSKKRVIVAALAAAGLCSAMGAQAGATVPFGEDKSIGLGLEMRSSFTSTSDAAPSGASRSADFNLDSMSLKISASLDKNIKAYFSTDTNAAGSVQLKDGYAQFDISPEFNVLAGRVLPPTDRANLDGPYYALGWAYPGVVSHYPSKAFGRDDGVLAWGKLLDKKLVYSVGVFQGRNHVNTTTTSNRDASLLYAGRVAFNFWDAEPAPLYYTGSTYYGSADILTVALVAQTQKDGVGNNVTKADYSAWNIDALMEKNLGSGVLTLEGAYYSYGFDSAAAAVDVTGGVTPGKATLLGGGFLLPGKVGSGKFQPYLRYQSFEEDVTAVQTKQTDVGLNYIIDGSSAKLSATYTKKDVAAVSANTFVLGMQLQF